MSIFSLISKNLVTHGSCFKRHFSTFNTSSKGKSFLFVSGANSVLSQNIIPIALKRDNVSVLGFTGNIEKAKKIYGEHPNLKLVQIDHASYTNAKNVTQIVQKILGLFKKKECEHIAIINTLGGTTSTIGRPDSQNELKIKNIDIPVNFIGGILEGTKGIADSTQVVHLSSIAASVDSKNCSYAQIRKEAENVITNTANNDHAKVIHLRVGIVLNEFTSDPSKGYILNNGHQHSPENWKDRKIVVVIGNGEQKQQPVSAKDVAEGAVNGALNDFDGKEWIVNGVSRDILSQKEILTYFTKGKIVCIHIPYEVAHAMTRLTSEGRLQPYAVSILEMLENGKSNILDPTDFERLLGTSSKSLDGMYKKNEITTFDFEGVKLTRYIYHFLKSCFANPKDAAAFFKAVVIAKGWKVSVIDRT